MFTLGTQNFYLGLASLERASLPIFSPGLCTQCGYPGYEERPLDGDYMLSPENSVDTGWSGTDANEG